MPDFGKIKFEANYYSDSSLNSLTLDISSQDRLFVKHLEAVIGKALADYKGGGKVGFGAVAEGTSRKQKRI